MNPNMDETLNILGLILSVVGQIATWVSVILVFLTLREMKKQRENTHRPELILPRAPLYGYRELGSKFFFPEWNNKLLEPINLKGIGYSNANIYNIGLGSAKNIILEWSSNNDRTWQKIRDYCYENSVPLVIKPETNWLNIEIENSRHMLNINFRSPTYDYLLPSSVSSEGLKILLPSDYIYMLSSLILIRQHQHDKGENEDKDADDYLDFPSLELQLTYQDIANITYKKKFTVKFKLSHLTLMLGVKTVEDKEADIGGYFEFTQIL